MSLSPEMMTISDMLDSISEHLGSRGLEVIRDTDHSVSWTVHPEDDALKIADAFGWLILAKEQAEQAGWRWSPLRQRRTPAGRGLVFGLSVSRENPSGRGHKGA